MWSLAVDHFWKGMFHNSFEFLRNSPSTAGLSHQPERCGGRKREATFDLSTLFT